MKPHVKPARVASEGWGRWSHGGSREARPAGLCLSRCESCLSVTEGLFTNAIPLGVVPVSSLRATSEELRLS